MDLSRATLLAANWKQNQRWEECEAYVAHLRSALPEYFEHPEDQQVELLLCPATAYLSLVGSLLHESAVLLGAQDVSRYREGAHTGEVSAGMLSDVGCDFCIVGHSERRAQGENTELLRQKLHQLHEADVTPILCLGEPLEIRQADEAAAYVTGQLEVLRDELTRFPASGLVIAYEPIWAIGSGRNAEPVDAQEMAAFIRRWLSGLSSERADEALVLYGGSVNPDNLGGYLEQPDIDGALIGGSSLEAAAMVQMVRAAQGGLKRLQAS